MQRQDVVARARHIHFAAEPVMQQCAVRQTGKRIMAGKIGEAALCFDTLFDFLAQGLVQAAGFDHRIMRVHRPHIGLRLGGFQRCGRGMAVEQQAQIGPVTLKMRRAGHDAAPGQKLRRVASGGAHFGGPAEEIGSITEQLG